MTDSALEFTPEEVAEAEAQLLPAKVKGRRAKRSVYTFAEVVRTVRDFAIILTCIVATSWLVPAVIATYFITNR